MPNFDPPNFDPIGLQVLWPRLVAGANEMAFILESAAFSHVVRDNREYACELYAASGKMIAQAQACAPGQLGSMCRLLSHFLEVFPAARSPMFPTERTPASFSSKTVIRLETLLKFASR